MGLEKHVPSLDEYDGLWYIDLDVLKPNDPVLTDSILTDGITMLMIREPDEMGFWKIRYTGERYKLEDMATSFFDLYEDDFVGMVRPENVYVRAEYIGLSTKIGVELVLNLLRELNKDRQKLEAEMEALGEPSSSDWNDEKEKELERLTLLYNDNFLFHNHKTFETIAKTIQLGHEFHSDTDWVNWTE